MCVCVCVCVCWASFASWTILLPLYHGPVILG